eukprot:CAMPEP_0176042020 /NCGR_PEP_ID=MMETSP0120_2-20121206/20849_1 /TAXON_ID=160619 /ORGANISM="Kryptoperidinium foliaceum, Strain CCMP 1326" /LENGTH=239 /DNA_ID=CAMNT_0017375431 /DNA_START=240 /DNA_END=959 /DNA_ORIENTATION=+
MPSQESLFNAKASFVNAVTDGITTLMQQCGYSRDRATSVLMRELSRGDSSRPSDEEIFDTMARYGLGIEEATKAIIVSRALRTAMQTVSPEKAIEHLAGKIAVRKLLYDSSEEDPSSDDECVTIRPDLRVEPIATVDRQARSRTTPLRKARLVTKSSRSKKNASATPNKLFRKRSIDEISPADKPEDNYTPRDRSGSVSEEVSAKIAKQSGDEAALPSDSTNSRNTSAVRSKRAHPRAE